MACPPLAVYDRINRIYRIFWLVRLWYETPTVGRLSTRKIALAIGSRYTGIFHTGIFFLHFTDSFRRSSRTTKIPCLSPVRANFRVAGEAQNRRLMSARVTAAELLSSVALAQEDARAHWHSHRHQSPDRAIDASPAFPCPPCRIHTVLTVNLTRNGRGRYP